ncbi:winged helix DNA-binding domain-containing protein [Streptomyces sp. NBC_01498]|uniref:winged helix DNA-binding domain-containing protein n=1 Tax=Streptomyces sp. NBC_01498 TaxID=2975870 RepID=UPI002E7B4915|nr:winged helix DNA-binding domain-containing protein [Streptomyces sp. NBC_01498]WTL23859.1 winged helix DNA-binding domain-containing protein [Streptomyces sp. NBC_01498]
MAPKTPDGAPRPVLTTRALNRATLARQLLLRRETLSARDAVTRLVGLQAQNVKPPYVQLAARLDGFDPGELSGLMASREVGRMVTLRSTLHTHTAEDCFALRAFAQPQIARELRLLRSGPAGVDLDRLTAHARELVEEQPLPLKELKAALARRWPGADPGYLATAARCLLPLVQTTPRGLWGRSGQVTLTTAHAWFGARAADAAADFTPDDAVLRYLAAFGPASVKDAPTWCRLTRLAPVFERLRERLITFRDENGAELFDLPDAPRPDEDTPAPPRFLPEFDNLLLSHADRTRVVPAAYRGRTWTVNQSHRTLLVDGFLAGVWRLEDGAEGDERGTLTVQTFAPLTRARRDAVAEEGRRLLGALSASRSPSYAVRFADFLPPSVGARSA